MPQVRAGSHRPLPRGSRPWRLERRARERATTWLDSRPVFGLLRYGHGRPISSRIGRNDAITDVHENPPTPFESKLIFLAVSRFWNWVADWSVGQWTVTVVFPSTSVAVRECAFELNTTSVNFGFSLFDRLLQPASTCGSPDPDALGSRRACGRTARRRRPRRAAGPERCVRTGLPYQRVWRAPDCRWLPGRP